MGRSPMTAEEQAYFEEQMDVLREDMDPAQFERIWNSGRALTMEQALGLLSGKTPGRRQHRGHSLRGISDQPVWFAGQKRWLQKFPRYDSNDTVG
jgi:hypothetical protein